MSDFTEKPWGILTGIRPAKIATKLLDEGMSESQVAEYFTNQYKTTYDKATLCLLYTSP